MPAGLKLTLGQGAALVGQAPQARAQVVLGGDPPRARIIMTGTLPAPSGGPKSKPQSTVAALPRPQASMATTSTLAPWSPTTGTGQQVEAVYFAASQPSAGNVGWVVVRPVRGAIELSAVSGTSTVSQSISVQSPMWAVVPPVGVSGSAPPPRAVTFAELKNLVRDESYWSLIRDIELDAACLSEGRLPLASEQVQGVACPLPRPHSSVSPRVPLHKPNLSRNVERAGGAGVPQSAVGLRGLGVGRWDCRRPRISGGSRLRVCRDLHGHRQSL